MRRRAVGVHGLVALEVLERARVACDRLSVLPLLEGRVARLLLLGARRLVGLPARGPLLHVLRHRVEGGLVLHRRRVVAGEELLVRVVLEEVPAAVVVVGVAAALVLGAEGLPPLALRLAQVVVLLELLDLLAVGLLELLVLACRLAAGGGLLLRLALLGVAPRLAVSLLLLGLRLLGVELGDVHRAVLEPLDRRTHVFDSLEEVGVLVVIGHRCRAALHRHLHRVLLLRRQLRQLSLLLHESHRALSLASVGAPAVALGGRYARQGASPGRPLPDKEPFSYEATTTP